MIFLDTNLAGDPPANACWVYPWYGEVCGDKAPRTTLTRLSYGAGAGLRVDLPRQQGFIRVYVGGEWIEILRGAQRRSATSSSAPTSACASSSQHTDDRGKPPFGG